MSSSVKLKQTRISFSERKLRPRSKCIKYVSDSSSDENSPDKKEEVNREKKRIPRRCSSEIQLNVESDTPRRASKRNKGKSPNYKENEADAPTPTKRKCHSLEKVKVLTSARQKVAKTPSTAFAKLTLESPRLETRSSLKPKELFPVSTKNQSDDSNIENLPVENKKTQSPVKKLSGIQIVSESTTPVKRSSGRIKVESPRDEAIKEEAVTPAKRKSNHSPRKVNACITPRDKPSKTIASVSLELEDLIESKNYSKPKELFPVNKIARKALHCAGESSLPCREKELKDLSDFLIRHLKEKKGRSLYISGKPGTGKTACLNFVIKQDKIAKGYDIVKINCVSVTNPNQIYKEICEKLQLNVTSKTTFKTENKSVAAIEEYLLQEHKMILLILDEIDELKTKSMSVLYKIFEWPSWENSKLVLIGIANVMDLTDRLLPRLQARPELKPVLMHFKPYSKDQMKKILEDVLSEAGAKNVFAPSAIQLLSAKVAAMSGDIRRALDLGYRLLIEEKGKETISATERTPLKEVQSQSASPEKSSQLTPKLKRKLSFDAEEKSEEIAERRSPRKSPRKLTSLPSNPSPKKIDYLVDTKSVFEMFKHGDSSSRNFKANEDTCFTLHEKLVICTLLLISKNGKSKGLDIYTLHRVYSKICKKRNIAPKNPFQLFSFCRNINGGVVKVGKGRELTTKVFLQWDETEIENAIKDVYFFSSILKDVDCLS